LEFEADAITAIADLAAEINASVENIGARRLQTVMERLLEEISFTAPDQPPGTHVAITAELVRQRVGELAKKADLAKFIL
jgi:ATP-dependent HslUV protease ATP-binding subunit HslU